MIHKMQRNNKIIIAIGLVLLVVCSYFMIKHQITTQSAYFDKLFFHNMFKHYFYFAFYFLFGYGYFATIEERNPDLPEDTKAYIVKKKNAYQVGWYGFWVVFAIYKVASLLV